MVQRKWGVRPIDPNNIKGVMTATRPTTERTSGLGNSQPCALHKTETAAVVIQPPGATWRHYNPEEGERVVRTIVLARCAITYPCTASQRGQQVRRHPVQVYVLPLGASKQHELTTRDITELSFAPRKHAQISNTHEDLNLRVPS